MYKPDPDERREDKIGGWTIPSWGGINLYDAPHLIEENEFQDLRNSRWAGKSIIPRPGQDKYKSTAPAPGYFIWGGYGGVMQHGGVGGVGFKDVPTGEIPGSPAGHPDLVWGYFDIVAT